MIYIVKNNKVSENENNYIFFNSQTKERAAKNLEVEKAIQLKNYLKCESVSFCFIMQNDLLNYKEVENITELINLPF